MNTTQQMNSAVSNPAPATADKVESGATKASTPRTLEDVAAEISDDLYIPETESKRKVSRACFACKSAHACCDNERPCGRCVKIGMPDICFDTEGKKRGRKPKRPKTDGESEEQKTVHITREPPPPTRVAAVHRLAAAEARERSLADINRLLMNEIRELKADQQKLYDEIRGLREKQAQTAAAAAAVTSAIPSLYPLPGSAFAPPSKLPALRSSAGAAPRVAATPQINSATNGAVFSDKDKATVIFDLTKKPATVISANEPFCRLLGYTQDEVLGASWHKFVHPAYVDRALSILAPHLSPKERTFNSTIKFDQVYQHKDGSIFRTLDSHTIFFNVDGTPVTNLVTIVPYTDSNSGPSVTVTAPSINITPYEEPVPPNPAPASTAATTAAAAAAVQSSPSPPQSGSVHIPTPLAPDPPPASPLSHPLSPSLMTANAVDLAVLSPYYNPPSPAASYNAPSPSTYIGNPPSPSPTLPYQNNLSSSELMLPPPAQYPMPTKHSSTSST